MEIMEMMRRAKQQCHRHLQNGCEREEEGCPKRNVGASQQKEANKNN